MHWLHGMGGHDIFHGGPLSLCLEGDALAAPLDMCLCLYSHLRPKEIVMHQVEHSFKAYMANLIMAPSQSGVPRAASKTN